MTNVFDFNVDKNVDTYADKNVDTYVDKNSAMTSKFFCGALRVKQPQELMDHYNNSEYEEIDPAAKFGPRVTARELNKALENLQTTRRQERGSITPTDQEPEEPQGDLLQPRVHIGTRYEVFSK